MTFRDDASMRIVHEGRGGYIELDDRRYPIEHIEGGQFSIHYTGGKHPNPDHLVALERLVEAAPDKWAIEGKGGRPTPAVPRVNGTVRQRIADLLRTDELTAQEISQRAGIPERDVAEHLRHLEHSLAQGAERLRTAAPHCIQCGFVFETRRKHTRPSRCPRCKSERLSPPASTLHANGAKAATATKRCPRPGGGARAVTMDQPGKTKTQVTFDSPSWTARPRLAPPRSRPRSSSVDNDGDLSSLPPT